MKSLKYIIFFLLIIIIGFSIYIAVQPNSFNVTRTKTINAPAAVIYNNVIDFKNWEAWSSLAEENPDLIITLPEQTKGIGSSFSWENKDGISSMKTLEVNTNEFIKQEMQIVDFPIFEATWEFNPNTDGTTQVTRTITGKNLPFLFKAYTAITGGMEKQIGTRYDRNLEKIDSIVVNSMKAFNVKINGITEYGGGFYLYKTINASGGNISKIMGQQYGSIGMFMGQNNIAFAGMPFTIYHDMNMENGSVIMSNAIPVKEKVIITDDTDILCDYQPKMKVLKATLKGNYTNLGKAWKTTMQYIADNNIEQSYIKPFEIYTTDPGDFPNPADWVTEIYIPIKE